MKIIFIEGNIGVGKTTLINKIIGKLKKDDVDCCVFLEPVEKWKLLLDKFAKDPKKYHFPVQNMVLDHFHDVNMQISKLQNKEIIIVERSALSSKYVFTKQGTDKGSITKEQYKLLSERFNKIKKKPDLHILLDASYETCFKRIKIRGRKCEADLPIEYIQELHDYHKQMANEFNLTIINAEQSDDKVLEDVEKLLKDNFNN